MCYAGISRLLEAGEDMRFLEMENISGTFPLQPLSYVSIKPDTEHITIETHFSYKLAAATLLQGIGF